MSRRRKLLLLALVLGSTAIYALWRAPEWGARLVEHALGRYFHRPVQVEAITVRPATLEFEIHGLRVGGITPEAPPFLEVPSARVRPSFAPLRGNRLVLSRVRVEGLRLRINAFPSPPLGPGGDDIPKMGGGGRGGGLQVAIERLVIVGGEFLLNHERVPLDVDLPDFHGRLSSRPEGGLAGHISFEPGRLKMGAAPDLPVGTEIDVVVHRGVVDVQGARLVAEKTNLAYHGRIRLAGRPQGQLSLEGPVDLAVLERHVFRPRPRPRGGRALERAPLDRRVAAADRRAHGGDGRGLPGRRRPALRELALLRRHARGSSCATSTRTRSAAPAGWRSTCHRPRPGGPSASGGPCAKPTAKGSCG